MTNVYTEKELEALTKAQLLEITAANGIEADDGLKKDDIKALIIAKGCPLPAVKNDTPPDNGGAEQGGGDVDNGNPKFSKEQLLKSQWYSHRRDILTALLEDGKTYSHAAVDRKISEFMKGKVK